MKNVVLIIKNTLHFIFSLLRTRKNSFLQKKEYVNIPASNLSIQTKTRRWKSISIHRNVHSILKMLAISGWNYTQPLILNKTSIAETLKGNFNNWGTKLVLPISLFLLLASNVYAAPTNYTVVGVDKFNGADGAGNSISQNATALGNAFNAAIRNGSTNDFTFDCGSMTTNSEDQPKGAIIFRYISASSFYAVTYHRDVFGTGNYMVRLKLNTLNSPLLSTSDLGSYTIPGGGGVTSLKVTAVGSSIKIWINGTLRIDVTNSALPTGSYGFGVGARFNSDDVIWNNVVWTAAASGPSASIQNFGTGTTSFGGVNQTSTTYLPNPTPAGTTFVRSSNGSGGGLQLVNSSALGTIGSILKATASTNGSVVKVTPILNNTAGKVAYARFKAMFGNSTGGNTAASGVWQMFLGNGSGYSDANGFTSTQVNVGLQFTYGASGAITMDYRNNGSWSTTSLTSNPLFQSVYYDFEIFTNNKSSGTENYTYNGVSSSVAVGKFDLYVNGRIIGNELTDGELASNSDITSIMFTGISSTSNVANIFIDDVSLHNTLPATISRLTNPSAYDLSSANYSFTSWANNSTIGLTPSNMKFHWGEVNRQNPTLAQSNATQDYVWGYNYSMTESRINGLDADGIEFRQANAGHSSTSSGNLGEAVVSVNASNRQNLQVSWVAALNANNAVDYKLRGQYRVGNTGAYIDLPGTTAAIEFNSTGATVGTAISYGPITLPAACNNQSEVQIRWVYYYGGTGTGAGDGIRLDEIAISSSCLAPVATAGPALTAICQGGTSAALGGSVALPATGGTWSTPAGGTFSPNATTLNATWTPPAGYSGTATLTLTTSGGSCGTATSSKTIVVNPTNTVTLSSAAGTNAQTKCINTAITNITYATTTATGATFSGLPAGVTGAWASNVVTISGTPTVAGTFNYTVTLTGGCGAVTTIGSIVVTPNNTVALSSAAGTNAQTKCINTAITNITYATTTATGATFSGLPAGVIGAWAANVATISGTPTASGTFNYIVTLTGGCGAVTATGTITVSPASVGGSVAGTATVCSGTNSTVLTLSGHTGAITRWESSLNNFATAGTNISNTTTSFTATNLTATASYRAVVTSGACAAANSASVTITVNPPTPAQPAAITGIATQCPALTSQTYSISAVTNATSYNWTVPTGWSITAGAGTASITVTTGSAGQNGDISVTAQNSCGTSSAKTLAVTVSPATPAVPTSAAGTNAACTTLSANWAASTNATAYFLDVSISNTFSSYIGAYNNLNVGNVNTVSVTGLFAGVTYYYRVRANNSCGTSASSSVITFATTPATPAQPGTISGTTAQCAGLTGQIYSISAVANATTYNWSVPAGWTITAGAGTASITLTIGSVGQNGNISVTAQNSCGASAARTLGATVTANPTVNVGAGLAAICAGGNSAALGGSVTSPATGGTWTSSAGGTFNPNATNLNATWTAPAVFSGTATLTLTSSGGICGTASGSKIITVNPLPANAGAITGTATVCQGQSGVVFSVPAITDANTYSWSYSGTGFTASGFSASIFGSFSPSATSGNLTVRGVNTCGNGVVSATYAITVNSVPSAAGAITGSPSLCQGQNGVAYSVAPITGATSYLWSYTGTGFTASGSTASITANFSASATAGVLTVRGVNSCGNGIASANYNISVAQLPGTPGTILGPSTACKGQAGFTFTIPAIANATSYNWVYTGTGVTFSGNTAAVTATISNTATSGVIRVRGVSACLNGPFSADFSVTVTIAPTVSITSNYCGNPGFVILTASSGFTNYLWNTGATTSFINADIAGQFTVTAANSSGCTATASVGVATELVTNGSFNAGNTGFTTNYNYVVDGAGQTEMYPEGTYAIVPNANTVHNAFRGTGHTPGGGPHMVINGSPALGQNIWSQNNIVVQPNTTYYFSAWGLSVVNGNNGVLRFSINGSQVGTTAFLPNGYSSTAGPFNWVRFYGSWNSGFATTANLSIVNLNTILGGNDFSLDDISFGTLSPVPLAVSPSTILGTTVCQGNELVLNGNAVGGASPFTYQWTGPNGFTSTVMNPTVTASAAAVNAGTYSLTVTDGFGCSASSTVIVTISALPLNRTPVASVPNVCVDGSSTVAIASSQTGISYQLQNDADDSPVGDPVAGTGGTISFPIDNLSATTTYNVLATGALTQCSVEMPTTVTITVAATPVLAIANQAICSGTVDLTAAAVTAGSTGSGTLSYWTDAAATTSLSTPTSVASSGVYFIKSAVGTCVDIAPVSVSITTTPITGFSYPTTPYCSTELAADATMNASALAGVFTSLTAGLVFSNTSTGAINLLASTPGTYTVRNTVSPIGGCPSVNSTSSVVITGAPLTGFSYDVGSDFCQIYSAQNPAPIFEPGAAAGTFASTFGLNFISSTTGVVNLGSSTPGNYAIWNTRNAVGGCAAESDTVFIDINPFVFAGTVSTSVSDDIICLGETVDLYSQTSAYSGVLLRERFNGSVNNWVRANSSVGGTVANAAWTLRPNNYSYNSNSYRSNDNTQFYMSNSEAQAGTTTLTTLRSPVMSAVGYTNLNLDFFHYFDANSNDTAQVQVSLNNTIWTTVATYTSDQGSRTGFSNPVINLNAYIGQPIFYVRFRYSATNDRQWAIDNVSLTGNCTKYNYNWVSAPAGFSSTSANPLNVVPPQNSFYVVNATNTFGCSNPSSPIPVTVNALPILTSNLTPPAVCGNELFTYVPTATPVIATIDWTRPATVGISNAAITAPQNSNPSEILDNTTGTDKNVIYNIRLNNNGCEQIVPLTIAVKPVPIIDIGSNLSVCNGSPAQLNTTVSNGLNVDSYTWSPATGLSSDTIADPTAIVPSASQNYTVTVQSTNGCTNTSAAVSVTNVGFGGTPGLWSGTQNNNWDDCRNWADGKVPDASTNVTIDGGSVGDILINGAQECNNLFFLSTAAGSRTIILNPTASLAASADVAISKTIAGGSIKLQIRNNGTLSCANLSLAGSSAGAADAVLQKDEVNTNVTINGNFNLDPGGSFDTNDNNNGTSEGILTIRGHFVNNANASDFDLGNVNIIFNGSALQTITCPTNQDFKSVTLDNSSLAGVRLANDIAISQQMNFVNGVLDLNSKTLTLGSATANATISGSGNNSYILSWDGADNGSVVHRVNSTGTPYLFPIGDLNDYTPFTVNLTSASLSSATLTAKLIGSVHPNLTTGTIYLGRYWSIEPTGITNPLYNVSYSYAAGDIFGDDALLFPAKYNNGGWQSCLESMSNAMIGNGSVNANDNTISWTGITTFSEFTGVGNGNALPIELLNFTAEPVDNEVQLKWITASEINNNYFTIERSTDGIHFENVVEQAGAGNSNTIRSYDAIDKDPYMGVSYYRLKQTDFNGDFTYSEMVVVNFTDAAAMSIESISSESENGIITIRCKNPANQKLNVQIFDSNGKIIHSSNHNCNTSNWVGSIQLGSISRGTYVIRIDMSGNMLYGKFVK